MPGVKETRSKLVLQARLRRKQGFEKNEEGRMARGGELEKEGNGGQGSEEDWFEQGSTEGMGVKITDEVRGWTLAIQIQGLRGFRYRPN